MKEESLLAVLDDRIAEIARHVLSEAVKVELTTAVTNNQASQLHTRLCVIKAKEYVTVRDAALLLSCSESHIRKLVSTARNRKSPRPIPYVDIEGVTVFPRHALVDWASPETSRISRHDGRG